MENQDNWSTADLVSFGNYLLSDKRLDLVISHPEATLEDKTAAMSVVSDADLANWKELNIDRDTSTLVEG